MTSIGRGGEIQTAKAVADIVPKTFTKRLSELNKRGTDTEDILSTFDRLDTSSVEIIPLFVAIKLKRYSSVSPSEVDMCRPTLAANANDRQVQDD